MRISRPRRNGFYPNDRDRIPSSQFEPGHSQCYISWTMKKNGDFIDIIDVSLYPELEEQGRNRERASLLRFAQLTLRFFFQARKLINKGSFDSLLVEIKEGAVVYPVVLTLCG